MAGDTARDAISPGWTARLTPALAPDGTQMVFQEFGEGGGAAGSAYHRRLDGSSPLRLGDGMPFDVSPDWKTALVGVGVGEKMELKLIPIGAGETMTLPRGSIHAYGWAVWHPDGKRVVIVGTDAEGNTRSSSRMPAVARHAPSQSWEGFPSYPWLCVSADGHFIAAKPKDSEPYALYPIDGGEMRPIPFLKADDTPLVFSDDGGSLFLTGGVWKIPLLVLRLDLKTGKRDPWLELAPPDRAGVIWSIGSWLCWNGRFHAYSYLRILVGPVPDRGVEVTR